MTRPCDSSYDRMTSGWRGVDPGAATYALVSDHNGPCSTVGEYDNLADAIEAAVAMDTDDAPTELEDLLDLDFEHDTDGLVAAAQGHGWTMIARASAGEHWVVLVEGDGDQ